MARGRMVSATIATDKALNSLSVEAELLYLKAIPHLDRDGLIVGDADLLLAKIAPRRMSAFIERMEAIICEWLTAGLVLRYDAKDGQVLYFLGFQKNNSIQYDREGASSFPPPPGYTRTPAGLVLEGQLTNNGATTDEQQGNSGLTHDQLMSKSRVDRAQITLNTIKDKRREIQDNTGSGDGDGCPVDPDLARVSDAYHQNIGLLTKIISDNLRDDIAEYGADWVIEAIGLATKAEQRKLSYVEGILKNWRRDGKQPAHGARNGHGSGPSPDDVRWI